MRFLAAAIATAGLFAGSPAAAQVRQPAVACQIADHSMSLDLRILLAKDGSGAPAEKGMSGLLEIHHQKVPRERRRWPLDGVRPVQFWNVGNELRVLLAFGAGDERIELVIEADRRPSGDDRHYGRFSLSAEGNLRLKGRIDCWVG